MKRLIILLLPVLLLVTFSPGGADELTDAYRKEYAFLKAQKEELAERLIKEQKQQEREMAIAKGKAENLQGELVILAQRRKNIERKTEKAEKKLHDKRSNKEIISSIVNQAKTGLEEYGITINDSSGSLTDTMEQAFEDSARIYKSLSSITIQKGNFYLLDGTTAKGEIVKIGGIAAYGISTKGSGALVPAGNNEYKIINKPGTDDDALALYNSRTPEILDIFIYENMDKDRVSKGKELQRHD